MPKKIMVLVDVCSRFSLTCSDPFCIPPCRLLSLQGSSVADKAFRFALKLKNEADELFVLHALSLLDSTVLMASSDHPSYIDPAVFEKTNKDMREGCH